MLKDLISMSALAGTGKTEVQKFRHRGFQPNDNGPIVMMFGNDPAPKNVDGSEMKELWDNDIEQVIFVKKHVD